MNKECSWQVLGKIVKAHGLRGEIKIVLPGETPENLTLPGIHLRFADGRLMPVVLSGCRPVSGGYLFRVKGYADLDAVAPLIKAEVVIRADDLPPLDNDEYYHFQLLGLTVRDISGVYLGELVEILPTGFHDVYCIRGEADEELLVPAVSPFIVNIDISAGSMVVDPRTLREEA
ncbi:MAG: 16S rRNA processing protein RimM [Xanthomonadaceae bacterium]|nr:16S rRNA processing protein RimM [Xanthomonadaceae bacterium]